MSKFLKFGLISLVVVIILFLKVLFGIYPNLLWFASLGYKFVYMKILMSKIFLGLVVGLGFIIISFINVKLALKFSRSEGGTENGDRYQSFKNILKNDFFDVDGQSNLFEKFFLNNKLVSNVFLFIIIFIGISMGSGATSKWMVVLKYLNQVAFGKVDPVFGKDISFYVFSLPFYKLLQGWFFTAFLFSILFVLFIYFNTTIFNIVKRKKISGEAKSHLSICGAIFLLIVAFGIYLSMFDILFSKNGAVYGAGYTDIHANLLGYKLFLVAAVFSAILLIVNSFKKGIKLPIAAAVITFLTGFVMLGVYPGLVQNYFVVPNEFAKENPYLKRNIEFSRLAYGLDKIKEKDFPLEKELTKEDISKNKTTIDNIRLWDHRPLKKTFSQLQEIRLYYEFNDVDIDRYEINGKRRQVMLSARELDSDKLTSKAQTWINRRLIYTHGYGLCMSPVSKFTPEGLPQFYIKDIPPQSVVNINVNNPQIYYGEKASNYVIVGTKEKEFDYPKGDKNIYTTYKGKSGIKLNSLFKRLLFAVRFGELKILISGAITRESLLLWKRDIVTRINDIAPFLYYDRDPYIVVDSNGRLMWILDAYTLTKYIPYSEPFRGRYNYIRNPVKVVVDAYEGDVTFYRNVQSDFILESYSKIFPGLFKPFKEMPDDIKKHIRYPVDMFFIQAKMYASYHMKDEQVFYLREDLWNIPKGGGKDPSKVFVEPYYINMRLPGKKTESFLLMTQFTPDKKNNMIAWLSAECDLDNYGELSVFKFPKKKLVYGPTQVEARIDQSTEISQKLSLWGQRGSRVIRGNLLVIPIEDSLIYVEPIYLQAEQGQIPELKRVVVAYGDKVVMDRSLEGALVRIFGMSQKITKEKEIEIAPTGQTKMEKIKSLTSSAQRLFEKSQEYQRSGNWGAYGQTLKNLEKVLKDLGSLAK